MKKAWELERELRDAAVPIDRRKNSSHWYESDFSAPSGDDLIHLFWKSSVPGSLAPEIPYQEMVQAWSNQGYDVSEAEKLIPDGIALLETGAKESLRVLTAALLNHLKTAPKLAGHRYHTYTQYSSWEEIKSILPSDCQLLSITPWDVSFPEKIYWGWVGQLAGGSFGTAIEGYTGAQIAKTYGEIRSYIIPPETKNDDVLYELVFLDVFEKMGSEITSREIGLEWIRQIPFGWSAEWIALRNLSMGIFPPESGKFLNFYSDWIGAQMRGMICGMLAPANPLEAIRLAYIDGVVSHASNGVYGEMFAAALTALAFFVNDPRDLISKALFFIPPESEYFEKAAFVVSTLSENQNSEIAWLKLEKHFERYNWIHAYPNLAADLFSLWYCGNDFTEAMALLAKGGNDVDCNGGLVGNILGIMNGVPPIWADPIGDLLETYIKGKERLSIKQLAARTADLAIKTRIH